MRHNHLVNLDITRNKLNSFLLSKTIVIATSNRIEPEIYLYL